MASFHLPLISILFFSLLLNSNGDGASDQSGIILALKESLGITNSTLGFESWTQVNTVCTLKGIKCNSNNSITEIDLTSTGISGKVPFRSLCQLPTLSSLLLSSNRLSGDLADVRNCTSLTRLNIAFNNFTGTVPDLSPLANLQELNIAQNLFTGPFPWDSLSGLTNLQVLRIGDNSYDRTEKFPDQVLKLTQLKQLYMSNCNIGGEIPPGIGDLSELVDLEMADNVLTGVIPPEITKLTNLETLELYDNFISGSFPAGFGGLKNLASLDVSNNSLHGNLSELRGLENLVSLQLFMNNLSGELPKEFGEFKKLINLSLYNNNLSGELPAGLGSWSEFNFIDVSTNNFSGEIPPDMCKKGTMQKLLMLENKFSGKIPASYANCSTLVRFRVNDNNLSGEVPAGLWGLPNLNITELAGNRLEGPIGAEIARAKSLNQLLLAGNQFSGGIPPEIGLVDSLVTLDLTSNNFSGEIPASIGGLRNVLSILLPGNRFSGEIPSSIGSLAALTKLDFSGNLLSGLIPSSLGQLRNLNSLDLSDNRLSGEIPLSLGTPVLSYLNLSNNNLTGAVPAVLSIAVFGESFLGNPGLCVDGNHNAIQSLRRCSYGRHRPSDNTRTIVTWFIAGCAILLAVLLALLLLKKHVSSPDGGLSSKGAPWKLKSFRVLSFDEKDIIDSIRPENLIGKGGSGDVYRVELSNREVVAVKHIWNDPVNSGKELSTTAMLGRRRRSATKEFEAEVATLSAIRHVNVVKLYCSITCEEWSLLVYEHLPNGSLWERLHSVEGKKLGGLKWEARYEIAVGAAKGLEYLHHGCDRPILHRDVKSSNILLDKFYKPRIADFGLAKILQSCAGGKDSSTHVIAGTHGYIAPEYAYTWKVTEKSDVYSFGVVLMELVTGRRPIEQEYGEDKDIVDWVVRSLKNKISLMDLVDNSIAEWARDEAVKVLQIAVLCTASLPSKRPEMRTVVVMLEEVSGSRVVLKDQKFGYQ